MADNQSQPRRLVLRRIGGAGKIALHDAETGQVLQSQHKVEMVQEASEPARLVVTFFAEKRGGIPLEFGDDA